MSLINDALKKAQKQRTGETPSLTAMPSVGGESATRIARRGKPAGFNTLVTWIAVGTAALAVVIVGLVFLLRSKAPEPSVPAPVAKVAPAPQSVQTTPSAATAAPAPVAPPPATATVALAPAMTTATVSAAPVAPPTAATVSTPVTSSSTIVLAPAPAAEPPKPATPSAPRKLENRAINYIDSIRVAGIRASSSDSKVLMNDRVYRIGDLVEAEMGLRLAGITTNSLTFEDEKGGRYTRDFR
jgi:cytoskeletal protein RodZ